MQMRMHAFARTFYHEGYSAKRTENRRRAPLQPLNSVIDAVLESSHHILFIHGAGISPYTQGGDHLEQPSVGKHTLSRRAVGCAKQSESGRRGPLRPPAWVVDAVLESSHHVLFIHGAGISPNTLKESTWSDSVSGKRRIIRLRAISHFAR